ncbi:MAG: aldehyde dehydrogenase family protein, partial [Acidobacteriota bacterium]
MTPLPAFRNEPYADFARPENLRAMEAALAGARAACGRAYPLRSAGRPVLAGAWVRSVNPSQPAVVVGLQSRATPVLAAEAIADAAAFFPEWARTPVEDRAAIVLRAAALLRARKYEFNAWLVLEAGKSWAEAEAETAEAIDFCEYYARQILRWATPEPLLQLPGERNELTYLPLGVGVVIPPWNFPLAILAGMTVAALVCGNTVVLKPSSETPVIAAQFVELLA